MGLPMKCQCIFKAPFYKEKYSKTPNGSPPHTSPTDYSDSYSGQDEHTRMVSKRNEVENVSLALVSRS